jgi:atypical dual specificity phosphatase
MSLIDFLSSTYRKAFAKVVGRPSNFSWVVPGALAGSGFPGSRRALRWLRKQGIDVILSLTDEKVDEAYANTLGMEVMRLPMVNLEGASPEALDAAVKQVISAAPKKVLVHCLAGVGRTGMVLSAYFVKTQGMGADEALAEVRKTRRGSVRRRVQVKAIREYAALLGKVGGQKPTS